MKYYSDKLNKVFDTVDALESAELEYTKKQDEELRKKQERKERAKEVDEAFKNYQKLLSAFIKDYGSYHFSCNDKFLDDVNKFLSNIFYF